MFSWHDFSIYLSRGAAIPNQRNVHIILQSCCTCMRITFPFCCGSPMDAECPAANVQRTFHDGATPSGSSRCARESTEAREKRLARDRAHRRERLASETAEEKERRLSQRRMQDRARHASRSSPVSDTRLEQWRSEPTRQRDARHARYRLNRERLLAAESPAERAARLQHLRARQQERIASETPEETAARRQRDREAHSHRPPPASSQPLLHQPVVTARMRKFHSQLASLEVSTCTTCLDRFPGMTTRHTAAGTRCHRDTHSPKAYSRENNNTISPTSKWCGPGPSVVFY